MHSLNAGHNGLEHLQHLRLRKGGPAVELSVLALGVQQINERPVRTELQQHPVLSVLLVREELAAGAIEADYASLAAEQLENT